MRVPSSYRRSPVAFNMTPMIDVVFLLIIFFLVSSHLVKQESQMPLPLPAADSGTVAVDESTNPRVTINVLSDGRLLLAGKPVRQEQLTGRLKARLADLKRGNDPTRAEQLEIRIRSDRRVPYRAVEPILLSAARAGIWNVTFAVYRSEDVAR